MRREPAPEVRAEHRRHHGAVAAARLARDAAVLARGHRSVARVHPRHHLIAEVGVVAAGARRVHELAPPDGGPAVDPDQDAGRRVAGREEPVGQLGEVQPERGAVVPHVHLARVALDHVDARVAVVALVVVPRRDVDRDRTDVRVAERVALQHLALDRPLVHASGELDRPGQHGEGRYQTFTSDRSTRSQARARQRPIVTRRPTRPRTCDGYRGLILMKKPEPSPIWEKSSRQR